MFREQLTVAIEKKGLIQPNDPLIYFVKLTDVSPDDLGPILSIYSRISKIPDADIEKPDSDLFFNQFNRMGYAESYIGNGAMLELRRTMGHEGNYYVRFKVRTRVPNDTNSIQKQIDEYFDAKGIAVPLSKICGRREVQ